MTTLTAPVEVTPAQREQLDEQGFFITDVLFDEPTLEAVRGEFNRMWQEHIRAARARGALTQEQAQYRPFMSRLHEHSEVCADFCRHPIFLELCRQLIGTDADMTWNQCILKPPSRSDNAFAWHQDMWYAAHGDYMKDTNPDI